MASSDEAIYATAMSIGDHICDKIVVTSKISTGINSDVFQGTDYETKIDYAVKVSKRSTEETEREVEFYELLKPPPKGIPEYFDNCVHPDNHEIGFIVMQKLGKSIKEYWDMCGKRFNAGTVSLIAVQVLKRLEYVHAQGIQHRDITPENLVMGCTRKEETMIYLVDFSDSKIYLDETDLYIEEGEEDIEEMRISSERPQEVFEDNKNLTNHQTGEISRRDDLISLGLMLVRLIKGYLPLGEPSSVAGPAEAERTFSRPKLCEDLPKVFSLYFSYVDSLTFFEDPDYEKMISFFQNYVYEVRYLTKTKPRFEWMVHSAYLSPSR